ncbi:protein SICKLE [Humulus lupulus]|uniref:protein SICKLE n=1 Tax=Humulus lupulus TaxID=3486 RepID=UPI002B40761E|nr:protein SICKLE [Humulus lupulus]
MEESKERRERLRVMRAKADQAENSTNNETTPAMPFSHLSNPLVDTSAATPSQEASRFDFYTNPMAPFSANKKRNTATHHIPSHHYAYPVPGPTSEMTQVAPQFQSNYYPYQGNLGPPNVPGSTMATQPRGHNFLSPGFRPMGMDSPSNAGRGGNRWHGSSLSPGSGRRGGRRGMGGRSSSTMDRQLGPERFYDYSMIEDPWKFLTPVSWKEVDAPLSRLYTSEASRPSFDMHKTKAEHTSNSLNPQPSLAEYLAASFSEAVNDAPSP